jgi:hypothetical protein
MIKNKKLSKKSKSSTSSLNSLNESLKNNDTKIEEETDDDKEFNFQDTK